MSTSIPGFAFKSESSSSFSVDFSAADKDKNGLLSENEFVDQLRSQNPGMSSSEIAAARLNFQNMAGSDGLLASDEVSFLTAALERHLTLPPGFDFTAIDSDKDNVISKQEWLTYVENSGMSAEEQNTLNSMFPYLTGDDTIQRSEFYNFSRYSSFLDMNQMPAR